MLNKAHQISETMYKEIQLLSDTLQPQRLLLSRRRVVTYLNEHAGGDWQMLIGLAGWADRERRYLIDYDFWIDLDADNKSERSWQENLSVSLPNCRLLLDYLKEAHDIDPKAVDVYFSGQGGFHLLLPFSLPHQVTEEFLLARIKAVVDQFRSALSDRWHIGSQLDLNMFTKRKVIRFPWSLHPSGMRKVPLSVHELDGTPASMAAVVQSKSDSFLESYSMKWSAKKGQPTGLADLVMATNPRFGRRELGHADTHYSSMVADMGETALCVRQLCEFQMSARDIDFNKAKMFLLSHAKALGRPKDIAIDFVKDFADRLGELRHDTHAKRRDRSNEVEQAARTVYKPHAPEMYDFSVAGTCKRFVKAVGPKYGGFACVVGYCPLDPRQSQVFTPGRIRFERLLTSGLTPVELWVFMHLAVFGTADSYRDLIKRTCLAENTLRHAVEGLRKKELVNITKKWRSYRISATRSIHKSMISKI